MFQKVIGQKTESDNRAAAHAQSSAPATVPAPQPSATSSQAPRPAARPAPSPSGRNILSSDVEIKGTIKFSNDLIVDGKIEGNINSDGALTVGKNAHIKAEIKTRSVIIHGKVHGNIEVTENVELRSSAELVGDIKAASLSIESGAIFLGKSAVGTPSVKPQETTSSKSGGKPNSKAGGKPANA